MMVMIKVYTETNVYTKTRLEVVSDQFELFLTYTGMRRLDREKLLAAIARGELAAIGAFLERDGFRYVEVEVEVDWELHAMLKRADGDAFNTDLPGWEENASPEVHQYARRLSHIAREEGLKVRHWIRVSREILLDPERHKELCDSLGYSFGSGVPPWPMGDPKEREVSVLDLPEIRLYERQG